MATLSSREMTDALDRSSRSRVWEMLFRSAAEGLVVVDRSGVILMHNPRLLELFGYATGELEGRPIEILLPEAARSRHAGYRDKYNAKPAKRSMGMGLDLQGSRKDGSVFPVEVSLNHFTVDDVQYVMGLVTDITLRREAEDVLQRTNADLERRVAERTSDLLVAEQGLREALETEKKLHHLKSRFVSMASHEFRTPLSTIMSSVDLIARYNHAADDEKVDKHVGRVRTKVRELTHMLNEFLSLERIEEGMVVPSPAEFDLVHLCIELMEELRTLAKPGQFIDYDHEGTIRTMATDRQMLAHVITNLITNAIKYSPENCTVAMRTIINSGSLTISVSDNGLGIPQEDQQHLFERFFRGSNVLTVQGTGLGLNIVKRYLDLLGGEIAFTSSPGNTVFTVRIPIHSKP